MSSFFEQSQPQDTDMSRVDICIKRGITVWHYMLISWFSHHEVEGTVVLLLQQIRPAIQVTRSDVYKETWRHSQTGFFLFFGVFFCGGCCLRRSVDISSCDCGDQKVAIFYIISICNHGDQNGYFKPSSEMFPTLKKLFLGHKPYQSTEDRQLQHKETFILNLSVVVFWRKHT